MGKVDDASSGMSEDRLLRRDAMAFFGRILASSTHEINNVLSIVDQSGGLLEDLMAASAGGSEISPGQLKSAIERIQNQAQRGLDMVRRLNRFAHSSDLDAVSFEVNETLQNLVSLIRRFADLKKVGLEFAPSSGKVQMRRSPFGFQQAVFRVYEIALGRCEAGDTITISCHPTGDAVVVGFSLPPGREQDVHGELASIAGSIEALGGRVDPVAEGERGEIRLEIPMRG